MDEQIEHVMDAVLERVIAMGAVDGGPAVAAHVQGDAAEAEGGEAAQLVAPAIPEVRPTVDEDDERAGLGAAGEIEPELRSLFVKCSVMGKSISDEDIGNSCTSKSAPLGLAGLRYRLLLQRPKAPGLFLIPKTMLYGIPSTLLPTMLMPYGTNSQGPLFTSS